MLDIQSKHKDAKHQICMIRNKYFMHKISGFISFEEATKCVKFPSSVCTDFGVGIFRTGPIFKAHTKAEVLLTKTTEHAFFRSTQTSPYFIETYTEH